MHYTLEDMTRALLRVQPDDPTPKARWLAYKQAHAEFLTACAAIAIPGQLYQETQETLALGQYADYRYSLWLESIRATYPYKDSYK